MEMEEIHPFIYFWIAFYNDGTCLPQFDLETGTLNTFASINQEKLEKFALFPFSSELALRINLENNKILAEAKEKLPYFMLKLKEDQRLIFVRRNFIHVYSYQHCNKCGYDWQWMPTKKEGDMSEIGLKYHKGYQVQTWEKKDFPLAICPKCGSFNAIVCPDCKDVLINELARPNNPKEHYFKCPKCNKEFPRFIKMQEGQKRRALYILGYQKTVDGKNIKQVMMIDEEGYLEMNDSL
jgi:transposase-like protein